MTRIERWIESGSYLRERFSRVVEAGTAKDAEILLPRPFAFANVEKSLNVRHALICKKVLQWMLNEMSTQTGPAKISWQQKRDPHGLTLNVLQRFQPISLVKADSCSVRIASENRMCLPSTAWRRPCSRERIAVGKRSKVINVVHSDNVSEIEDHWNKTKRIGWTAMVGRRSHRRIVEELVLGEDFSEIEASVALRHRRPMELVDEFMVLDASLWNQQIICAYPDLGIDWAKHHNWIDSGSRHPANVIVKDGLKAV